MLNDTKAIDETQRKWENIEPEVKEKAQKRSETVSKRVPSSCQENAGDQL